MQFEDLENTDLASPKDTLKFFNGLRWIGGKYEPEGLTFVKNHARHLPVSLTTSATALITNRKKRARGRGRI